MSTPGSPGGRAVYSRPTPPQRGSFPLDHDGECAAAMERYLRCMRAARNNVSDVECRAASAAYLRCRMAAGLMAPDSMANLGFAALADGHGAPADNRDGAGPTPGGQQK